jgi:uncharacterized membrane protein
MAKRIPAKGKDDDKKLYAFLATFLSIIGFLIALIAKKDDKYVMFYARQSLVVFIVSIIAAILSTSLGLIPIIGAIISVALNIIVFILWLTSWVYALSGEMREVPVVGHFARSFKL